MNDKMTSTSSTTYKASSSSFSKSVMALWVMMLFMVCHVALDMLEKANSSLHVRDGLSHGPPSLSHRIHPIMDLTNQKAVAMPSIRIKSNEERGPQQNYYGGKGDKAHLGGFSTGSAIDMHGVSPAAWKFMIQEHGIKSVLDVGCGRGISTSWFHMHGVDAQCVEGSHDGVMQSFLPQSKITEHDFSRGPWWPEKTVDAAWSVEVLEHIGKNFHKNLMPAFRQAALLYVSHSTWGGYHHVEVHEKEWWIARFQSFGFVFSDYLTEQVRTAARNHREDPAPGNQTYNGQHIRTHMLVFINPMVASLPEHAHLLSELACTNGAGKDKKRACGTSATQKEESTLPPEFQPLRLTDEMDAAWEKHIFGSTLVSATNG